MRDEALGLAVHGQGFASREVTDDLAALYPEPIPGLLNVGLLHTSLDGRPGHEPYAPTSLAALRGKGYDYWALGHVHRREVLCTDPWVVFPGNLQGRDARETGAKGATLIEAPDGRIAGVQHRELDVVRWARCEVDASDAASPADVIDLFAPALERALEAAGPRLLVARVQVRGASRAHAALCAAEERWESELRARALEVAGGAAWLEKVRFATAPALSLDALAEQDDALGALLGSLRAARANPAELLELAEELAELREALPREAREGPDGVRLDDPEWLAEALADVERALLPRLFAGEGT